MLVTLIPFFLAARLPVQEDGAWRHGAEYVYTVHMSMMKVPMNTGVPSEFHVASRLRCVTKHRDVLSCSLKQERGFDHGGLSDDNGDDNGVRGSGRNVTDAPVELLFDRDGVKKVITDQRMRPYDLNVLRLVLEQLHTGDDFVDLGGDRYAGVTESTVGRCNVSLRSFVRPRQDDGAATRGHDFRLELLSTRLRRAPGQTIVIQKATNLDNCSSYADNYYRKYGENVVSEGMDTDLESMVSYMEIGDTDFISATIRKGMMHSGNRKYHTEETITLTLEEIKPAAERPPAIVNPVETKLIVNYDAEDTSDERR